jgi:environmental stress-induced protein Ves
VLIGKWALSSGRQKEMKEKPFLKDTPYWIIRKDKVKKSLWSGGTSSQLFISPDDADIASRDFIFRVSAATVNVEESLFTFFDNYDRIIMTTDKDFVLIHNDDDEVFLSKYEPHFFLGEDKTRSKGKVNDYNLIMKRGVCRGDTMAMSLAKGSVVYPRKGNDKCDETLEIVYCAMGRLTFRFNDIREHLVRGDVLMINHGTMGNKYVLSNEDNQFCDLVITMARISHLKKQTTRWKLKGEQTLAPDGQPGWTVM